MGKSVIIQGTRADVGKSLLVAGLCRLCYQDGLSVAPFKAYETRTNAFVTREGFELGRTQIFQAQAARLVTDQRMNPVLLSQETKEMRLFGQLVETQDISMIMGAVVNACHVLSDEHDLVLIEGSSSLVSHESDEQDMLNNKMIEQIDAPIILVTDAQSTTDIVQDVQSAMKRMPENVRARVKGVIMNKQQEHVVDVEDITTQTQLTVLGVVPQIALNVDSDDRVSVLQNSHAHRGKDIDVAVIKLKYTSNFTDVHPLEIQSDVSVRYVNSVGELGNPDLVILPGSNNTMLEITYLRESGLEEALLDLFAKGTRLFGICGGYQLLGKTLDDSQALESNTPKCLLGMGLLDVDTVFTTTRIVSDVVAKQGEYDVSGYEIHRGQTVLNKHAMPFATVYSQSEESQRFDGAMNDDGRVQGTYVHGVFDNLLWTRQYLNAIRLEKGLAPILNVGETVSEYKNREYNKLAQVLRDHLDMTALSQFISIKK